MKIISEKSYREIWLKFEKIFSRQLKNPNQKSKLNKVYYFKQYNFKNSVESININENEIQNLFNNYDLIIYNPNLTSSILPTFIEKFK